jgi:hypothetical protein
VNCGLPAHSPIAQTSDGRCLEPLIDANVTTAVQLDAGLFKRDPGGVGNAPRPDQDVAALDLLLAGECADGKADLLSRSADHIESFGRDQNLNSFVAQDPLHLLGDVGILAGHQLRPGMDDRDAAAEPAVSLSHFKPDIAAAEHDQM